MIALTFVMRETYPQSYFSSILLAQTYTMGILEFISNEHAGIIPRAVAQIFHHVEHQRVHTPGNEITISLSFLQLYRETIQDLLAPANGTATSTDDNLLIREDPQRGFYVEGLQEFVVRNYEESGTLFVLLMWSLIAAFFPIQYHCLMHQYNTILP